MIRAFANDGSCCDADTWLMNWKTPSEASKRDISLMFRPMHTTTARVFRNAISEEAMATENSSGGCEFE